MAWYRFLRFGPDHNIGSSDCIEASDDVSAVKTAHGLGAKHGGELWIEKRLIVTFEPNPEPNMSVLKERMRLSPKS